MVMNLQDSLHCYGLYFITCADVSQPHSPFFISLSNTQSCSARVQHTRQSALLRAGHRQGVHALHLDPHPGVGAVVARLRLIQRQFLSSLSGSIQGLRELTGFQVSGP